MKILIINPDYGMTQEEMALRCRILEEYTAPDTQLAMVCPQSSGVELNSALDVVLAAPEIVQLAADGQNAGFDAVVLYCFSDPVIDACREALRIPVIGGAQASCLAALNVCRSFGVILADEARLPEKKLFLRTLGVSPERIVQIAAVNLNGISPWADRETTFKKLLACGQKMMRETHTEAIVLGRAFKPRAWHTCYRPGRCRRNNRRKYCAPAPFYQQSKLPPAVQQSTGDNKGNLKYKIKTT